MFYILTGLSLQILGTQNFQEQGSQLFSKNIRLDHERLGSNNK